jgi:hypothetical protein
MAPIVVLRFDFEAAIAADVGHAHATSGQHAADQEAAVAVLRVLLTA